MSGSQGQDRQVLLLDACCLLNLFATGHIHEILRVLSWRFAVAAVVAREAMWIYGESTEDDPPEREPVDVNGLVPDGLLTVVAPENEVEYSD